MQEALLQFIWQYNLYHPGQLCTTSGVPVQVVHPGTINRDSGPDFSMAKVLIDDVLLVGNVEIHVRTSDWLKHGHSTNQAYAKTILHVVFEHDLEQLPGNIPVLTLAKYIPTEVIARYSNLIKTTANIPCAQLLNEVPEIIKSSWLNRMLVERWEEKLTNWEIDLLQAKGDWQTLFYWRLAANFGFKVNASPFLLLAQSLPLKILLKQASLFSIEALLLGQAGFLKGNLQDEYPKSLQQEYYYLQSKYTLKAIDPSIWKLLRMRPANFPTIRLSQFAALIHQSPQLFNAFTQETISESIPELNNISASAYWDTHFLFEQQQTKKTPKKLGADSANNILINTIAPLRFLYAHQHRLPDAAEKALRILDKIPPEDNNIIRLWKDLDWKPHNAAASQAQLQLFNSYCANKKCLQCAVGLHIIKSRPHK